MLSFPHSIVLAFTNPQHRYQRATILQIGSSALIKCLFQADTDPGAKDQKLPPTPPLHSWIFDHDCQEYTDREFAKVAEAIQSGDEYSPHNVPADGKYHLGDEPDSLEA